MASIALHLSVLPFFNCKNVEALFSNDDLSVSCEVIDCTRDLINDKIYSPHPRALHVVHINAEDLIYHFADVHEIFNSNLIPVIMISETWLKPFHNSSIVHISGYNLIRHDRVGKGGGGVCMYIAENIRAKVMYKSELNLEKPEFLIVEIIVNHTKILLITVYRAPTISCLTEFENVLFDFVPNYENVIIGGDFNTNLLIASPRRKEFKSIIESCNLYIIQSGPTYQHSPAYNPTLLDLLIVNNKEKVINSGQISDHGISKHDLIFLSYSVKVPKFTPKLITARNIKGINWVRFHNDAASVSWINLDDSIQVDDLLLELENKINNLFDKHAPYRTFRVTKKAIPWITDTIIKLMKIRDNLKRLFRKDNSSITFDNYKIYRNKVKQLGRNAKRKYFAKNLRLKQKPAILWKNVRNLGILGSVNNFTIEGVTANDLNAFYTNNNFVCDESLVNHTISDIMSNQPEFSSVDKFCFNFVSVRDVRRAFYKIKSKARGVDKLSIDLLIPVLRYVLPPFTLIINKCIISSKFPCSWKKAIVRPIPKTSSPTSPADTRPISIISVLAKTAEHIIDEQIATYVQENNLLTNFQSGFRCNHSTATALVDIADNIRQTMDKRKVCVLVLLDFQSAFNLVNHLILVAKLMYQFNFSHEACLLIKNYLSGRFQCVNYDNSLSDWLPLFSGTPQGSVPSPRLFNLYINDLYKVLKHCKFHFYADDVQVSVECDPSNISEAINLINEDIAAINTWAVANCMRLNPPKTQCIVIGNKRLLNTIDLNSVPCIQVSGVPVPFLNVVKNLGVLFDSTLSMDAHISHTCNKAMKSIFMLNSLRKFIPDDCKKYLVQALVFPHLFYCDVLLTDINSVQARKLQLVQNACCRFVFGLRKYDHISKFFVKLNWPKLIDFRKFHIACILYQCLHCPYFPAYLKSRFSTLSASHSINTRSGNNRTLAIPQYSLSIYSNSFTVAATRLWNELPISLRNARSLNTFKKGYKALYF